MTIAVDVSAFRSDLVDAGILLPAGADGVYAHAGRFEDVVTGVMAMVSRAGADASPTRLRFAPVLPRWAFERTGYLRSFPDLAGVVYGFGGGDADHAALLRALDDGADPAAWLSPTELTLCSAACHPLYPLCEGTLPAGGKVYEVLGHCFRHEPSLDPIRMQTFRQQEQVYVGEPEAALRHRDAWVERGQQLLSSLGLDVTAEVANDPFFGRAGRLLAIGQRQAELKLEITCEVGAPGHRISVSSGNCHGDHFGHSFEIGRAHV